MPRLEGVKRELREFPKGTVVGIVASKYLHDPQNYQRLTARGSSEFTYKHWQVTSPNYWNEVIKFCGARGLEVVYLADWEKQERCSRLLTQKDPIIKELN